MPPPPWSIGLRSAETRIELLLSCVRPSAQDCEVRRTAQVLSIAGLAALS